MWCFSNRHSVNLTLILLLLPHLTLNAHIFTIYTPLKLWLFSVQQTLILFLDMEIVSDNDEDFGLNVNIGEYVCTIVARCTSCFICLFFFFDFYYY